MHDFKNPVKFLHSVFKNITIGYLKEVHAFLKQKFWRILKN